MREIKSSKVKEKKAVSKKVDVMLGGRVGEGWDGPGGRSRGKGRLSSPIRGGGEVR